MPQSSERNGRRAFLVACMGVGVVGGLAPARAAAERHPSLHRGHGTPGGRAATAGDFFLDRSADTLYGPYVPGDLDGTASGWGWPTHLRSLPGAPRGKTGNRVSAGTGPPAPATGDEGDFFLDTRAAQLYGPRRAGVWGAPLPLTGAASAAVPPLHRSLAAEPEQLVTESHAWRDGTIARGAVEWPDGTAGTFEVLAWSPDFPGTIDSYRVTYGSPPTVTYKQPPVHRDAHSGAVQARPAIVVESP